MYHIIGRLQVFKMTFVIPPSLTASLYSLVTLHVPAKVYLDGQHEILQVSSVVYRGSVASATACFAAFSSSLPYLFLPLPFLLALGYAALPHP